VPVCPNAAVLARIEAYSETRDFGTRFSGTALPGQFERVIAPWQDEIATHD
jgi:hypothetical protein